MADLKPSAGVPVQGLDLFEVYEHDGSLLLVTSDGDAARTAAIASDRIVRRPWATAAVPTDVPFTAALRVNRVGFLDPYRCGTCGQEVAPADAAYAESLSAAISEHAKVCPGVRP